MNNDWRWTKTRTTWTHHKSNVTGNRSKDVGSFNQKIGDIVAKIRNRRNTGGSKQIEKFIPNTICKIIWTFIQSNGLCNLCSRMNKSALCTDWQNKMTGGSSRNSRWCIVVVDCKEMNESKSVHGSCGWKVRKTSWWNICGRNW